MYHPPQKGNALVLALVTIYFLLPKINIIGIETSSSGIRADDFIAVAILMLTLKAVVNKNLLKIAKPYLTYIAFGFVTAIILLITEFSSFRGFLYSFRQIEYAIFLLAGFYLHKKGVGINNSLMLILIYQTTLAILQQQGLIRSFTSAYGAVENLGRSVGATGGPWELAPLITLLAATLAKNCITTGREKKAIAIYLVGFVAILTTGSRIGMLGFLFSTIIFIDNFSPKKILTIGALVSVFFIAFSLGSATYEDRSSKGLNITENIGTAIDIYNRSQPSISTYAKETLRGSEMTGESDLSWIFRFSKWAVAIKIYIQNPGLWLTGLGPGLFGNALDGGVIRILFENGIIGFILFFRFFLGAAKKSRLALVLVSTLLINMIFIDLYISSKFIPLLLFILAYHWNEKPLRKNIDQKSGNYSVAAQTH
ncbi:hypothetical protein PS903_02228 [Pseudomonas fluorescens]|nr:hypothetical protein PS903_02228 [Pseudomonas fluorescens]